MSGPKQASGQQFVFRRTSLSGFVPPGINDRNPEFNLDNVLGALELGWDPNTTWTEEELVFPAPAPKYMYHDLGEPWCHFNTALHRALRLELFDVAQLLLDHGADINRPNAAGRTVLHEAVDISIRTSCCDWNRWDVAAWTLKRGGDPNRRTEARSATVMMQRWVTFEVSQPGGVLPLGLVLPYLSLRSIQLLVDGGADPNLPVIEGEPWWPLDLALVSRHAEAMWVLHGAGASFSCPIDGSTSTENAGKHQAKVRDLITFSGRRFSNSMHGRGTEPAAPGIEETFWFVIQTREFKVAWDSREDPEKHKPDFTFGVREANSPEGHKFHGPIDKFCEILSDVERRNLPTIPASFCADCSHVLEKLTLVSRKRSVGPFQRARNVLELQEAAASNSCPLCRLLLDGILEDGIPSASSHVEVEYDYFSLRVKCGNLVSNMHLDFLDADLLRGIPMEPDITGDSWMSIGRTWLRLCKAGHQDCLRQQDLSDPVLPSRVIDVGQGTNAEVRLVETNGELRGVYCALSYCRGPTEVGTTTVKNNLEQYKISIPTDSLQATFRDAITAARGMGFTYLWIDALCIVQDDVDDWDSEVAKMGSIYASASLTISTLTGTDWNERLFPPRPARQRGPIPFPIPAPDLGTGPNRQLAAHSSLRLRQSGFSLRSSDPRGFEGPIHGRSWPFQELMLSTRVLWFGRDEVHWECLTVAATEGTPAGVDFDYGPRHINKLKTHVQAPLKAEGLPGEHRLPNKSLKYVQSDPYLAWQTLVTEYTKKSLAVEAERIPGILGMALHMAALFKSEFVAGVWKGEYCLRSLLWSAVTAAQQTGAKKGSMHNGRYPSWTWAYRMETTIAYIHTPSRPGEKVTWPASVVSMDVALEGKAQRSASGFITIKGPAGRLTPEEVERVEKGPPSGCSQTEYFILHRDDLQSSGGPRRRRWWYLDMMKTDKSEQRWGPGEIEVMPASTVSLLLEAVDEEEEAPLVFRRVAIGKFWWNFADMTVREVTIV